MQEELLQIFDDARNPIGALPRSIVKAEPRLHWHGCSNIWLVNANGEILCSKRADWLRMFPGRWQIYFGGHAKAGQTFLETAVAELAEEAGLVVHPTELLLIESGGVETQKKFFENFAHAFNGGLDEISFSDNEVAEAKWASLDEVFASSNQYPDLWCDPLSAYAKSQLEAWINAGRPLSNSTSNTL